MDRELVRTALICLTIVIALGIGAASVVMWKIVHMAGNAEPAAFTALAGQGNAVRLLTVLLVICAATYLSLTSALDNSVSSPFSGGGALQHQPLSWAVVTVVSLTFIFPDA